MGIIQKKVCLLGDFSVGKTSLIRRFVDGSFDDKYLSTIGVKISRKSLIRNDHTLNLLIWDLAGGDDFSKMGASYLRGAVGAIIVCDLTRQDTLDAYSYYAGQLHAINPNAVIVFAANKADLVDTRAISDDELQKICDELGGPYLLTSAKDGLNVEASFSQLADLLEG